MSSRILDSANSTVTPFTWRSVGGNGQSQRQETRANGVDWEARAAELEAAVHRRVDEARETGRREGIAEGERRAMAELAPLMARLAKTIETLTQIGPRLRKDAEDEMVRLAVAIARRILHREFAVDPAALIGIANAALQAIDARELNKVRVHPEDAGMIQAELQKSSLPVRVEVTSDITLERGAVVFETTRGILDASVNVQLEEIQRGLTDLVGRRR